MILRMEEYKKVNLRQLLFMIMVRDIRGTDGEDIF